MRDRRLRLQRLRLLQQRRQAAVVGRIRQPNRGKKSVWLFELPDSAFKLHCRFSKASVRRIASLLDGSLRRVNHHGSPVQPVVWCFILRTNGLASGGLSQNASRVITSRVVEALVTVHHEWIRFPTVNEMRETSLRFFRKFGLPDIFGAVDGCHMRFEKGTPGPEVGRLYLQEGIPFS